MHRAAWTCCWLGLLIGLPAGGTETPATPLPEGGDLVLHLGVDGDESYLGFGWSRGEGRAERRFRWIKRMEADVWVELDKVSAVDIWFKAAPLYLNWRRQVVGLYVNNHFVSEWVCPDQPGESVYHARIPAETLRTGRNRLTFRMAYRKHHRRDRRELALKVETIILQHR